MSLSLLALKLIFPPVAKTLLESFGIDSKLPAALLEQAIDTGTDAFINAAEAKKMLSQRTDQIAKQVKADIQPLFEHEARNLEEGSRNAILSGIAETLIKARLTPDKLTEINLDTEKLKRYLLNTNLQATQGFSWNETALYEQAIAIVSDRLIESAPEIEGFQLSQSTTILQRLQEIADQLRVQRQQAIQAADQFASEYRRIVQDELDRLEVFGLQRLDRLSKRQSLSTAYITLSVSGAQNDYDAEKSSFTLMEEERSQRHSGRRSGHVDQIICDCRRIVIRGGAGAGKSTLLQWLAVRAATQSFTGELQHWNYKIPFFIRLRSLVGKEFPTPETFPALIARNFAAMMPSNWAHRYLQRGQALVLIDGVDELPRQERQDFFEALKDLVRDFSQATYIITSRPSGLKDSQGELWQDWEDWVEAQKFVNLTLELMKPADVEKFVSQWHAALSKEEASSRQSEELTQIAENLKRQIRQRSELRRLASTPLLCAMICALHHERQETLPSERLKLYDECIDMLLNRRDEGRKIPVDKSYPTVLNERQKIELLQSLALKLMRLKRSELEADRVDSHFEAELKQFSLPEAVTGKQIRDLFVDRAALLREPLVGQIDFAHRTFQEYLAAKAALNDDSLEELLQQAADDQWRESIIAAAGLARSKERVNLLNFLIEQGNRDPESKHYLHLLAVACLETATSVDQTARDHVLSCAKDLLPPKDEDEIAMVARAGNEIVPLLKYEPHYSAEEACNCIQALVKIGSKAAMQALVDYAKATFDSEDDQYLIGRAFGLGWGIFDQNTYISDVLAHLKSLDLGTTGIVDVSPLGGLSQLKRLDLDRTQVSDVSPLSELSQLNVLYLSGTQVSDVSPLSGLSQLKRLDLSGTQVSDVSPLSELSQLNVLDLSGTQVSDVAALEHLPNLRIYKSNGFQARSPVSTDIDDIAL